MECPYCKYEDTDASEDRNSGNFWTLSNDIELSRETGLFDKQKANIKGCPNCKRIFVSDYG